MGRQFENQVKDIQLLLVFSNYLLLFKTQQDSSPLNELLSFVLRDQTFRKTENTGPLSQVMAARGGMPSYWIIAQLQNDTAQLITMTFKPRKDLKILAEYGARSLIQTDLKNHFAILSFVEITKNVHHFHLFQNINEGNGIFKKKRQWEQLQIP